MAIDFRPTRKAVVDAVKQIGPDVYEGVVPDDEQLRTSNGRLLPYIVVMFTNPIRAPFGKGITGARQDLYSMSATVHITSTEYKVTEDLHHEVFNALAGMQPPNGSELVPWGGFSINSTTDKAPPTKFISSQGFRTYVNTNLVE